MKELIIAAGVNGTGKSSFKGFWFIKLIQGTLNGAEDVCLVKSYVFQLDCCGV